MLMPGKLYSTNENRWYYNTKGEMGCDFGYSVITADCICLCDKDSLLFVGEIGIDQDERLSVTCLKFLHKNIELYLARDIFKKYFEWEWYRLS